MLYFMIVMVIIAVIIAIVLFSKIKIFFEYKKLPGEKLYTDLPDDGLQWEGYEPSRVQAIRGRRLRTSR